MWTYSFYDIYFSLNGPIELQQIIYIFIYIYVGGGGVRKISVKVDKQKRTTDTTMIFRLYFKNTLSE